MFRLTREVRFSINSALDGQLSVRATNSYGGFPSLTGAGQYFALQVTVGGGLQQRSNYLRNIKDIDDAVRRQAIPFMVEHRDRPVFSLPAMLFDRLKEAWPGNTLERIVLWLTPYLSVSVEAKEDSMIRLSQKFEFSATHRLHNPNLDEAENRKTFGKCNNPHGHGHNYELQVTLAGKSDASGVLMDVPAFERIVAETVIDKFDHKNLNIELSEFRELIPSVENIAAVIFRLLQPRLKSDKARLASVTVWETPKTWCEYSE